MNCDVPTHLPVEAIDTLEQIQGTFPGSRRAHAKGQIYEASFTPNGNAIPYTTALHLQEESVPALVRFSNSLPDPNAADFLSPAKGMSVQFYLPDGETSHLVSTTIPMFVTNSPESFIEMIKMITSNKTGIKSLDLGLGILELMIKKFPESKNVLLALKEQAKQPPTSYASIHYYPIHAFYFVNNQGNRQAVKYEWHPVLEKESITKFASKIISPNFLMEELEQRLKRGPIYFDLIIRLGEESDNPDDPTDPWPEDRQQITIGQLAIYNRKLDVKDNILFDPTNVPKGIELTNDPILHFRHDAYAISFERRMNYE